MTEDQTYVMVKPDGVRRGLIGRIMQRFEDKGFRLCGLKMRMAPQELLKEHYSALINKPFFPQLMSYIGSGPVVCMCWTGKDAPFAARGLIGATDPLKASTGTIRGDFGLVSGRNIVHGSDSPDAAMKEISLWFAKEELLQINPTEKANNYSTLNLLTYYPLLLINCA